MAKFIKWPEQLLLVRHDVSFYNILKIRKKTNAPYREFSRLFETDPHSPKTLALARQLAEELNLGFSDPATPLLDHPSRRACETGQKLSAMIDPPDVIFVSPFLRTVQTYEGLCAGWPALRKVRMYEEERIREQDHGLASLYSDWRIFQTLHPEQRLLYQMLGRYRFCFPQGEDVPRVRERALLWNNTITRDWHGKKVWAITHHLFILSYLANMERWSESQFIDYDENHKPVNCGVTLFQCNHDLGENGKFELKHYSKKLFSTPIAPELTEGTCMDSPYEDEMDWRK